MIRYIGWSCSVSLHLNRQRQSRWTEPSSSACFATKPGWSHVPFVPGQPHVGWLRGCMWPLLVGLGPLKGQSISPSQRGRWLWQGVWLTEVSDALPVPERKCSPFGNGKLLVWFFHLVLWWYSEVHLGCRVVTWEGLCFTTTTTLQMLDVYGCFPIWLENFLSGWCSASKSAKIRSRQIRAVSPVSSSEIQ